MGRGHNFFDDSSKETLGLGRKACYVCDDFNAWRRNKKQETPKTITSQNHEEDEYPLDRVELGQKTWALLHTTAAYYPEKPSEQEKSNMKTFISAFSKVYPCEECATDFRKEIKKSPPDLSSNTLLSNWLCKQHNIVNEKLGKPEFDCSKVFERWKFSPNDEL